MKKKNLNIDTLIREKEIAKDFNTDLLEDPVGETLKPGDVDYLYKKHRFKNKLGVFFGNCLRFYARHHFKTKVYDIDNAKSIKGGAIITLNHFDPLDSGCATEVKNLLNKKKKLYIVIKENNYTCFKGILGYMFKYCDTLPLSSNIHTMKEFNAALKKVLDEGNYVLIYPEQAMWPGYIKPRPLKSGAYYYAVKFNVPIIPLFTTFTPLKKDTKQYHVHVLNPIIPNIDINIKEEASNMMMNNYNQCVNCYESFYKTKLEYEE